MNDRLFIICFLTVAAMTSMVLLHSNNALLTIAEAAIAAAMLFVRLNKERLFMAIAMFVIGAIVETTSTHFKIWVYPNPDIFGIPYWIPFVWIVGTLFVLQARETLSRYRS